MLSNPKRLMIIAHLSEKELSVGDIAAAVGAPIANISQHLRALKDKEIVTSRKEGQTVYYRLTDRRLVKACDTLRKVLMDRMIAQGRIAIDDSDEED